MLPLPPPSLHSAHQRPLERMDLAKGRQLDLFHALPGVVARAGKCVAANEPALLARMGMRPEMRVGSSRTGRARAAEDGRKDYKPRGHPFDFCRPINVSAV